MANIRIGYKWIPWRFILTRIARAFGFADPIPILSSLRSFAKPSEVVAPIELLRAGVSFHARGLINKEAIQHNLDWVWPYWIERQFRPKSRSFIPRAFSLTHINMTHRNWTAVGIPGFSELPIVDPRGLVTPFLDKWSLDAWVISEDGRDLIPSQVQRASDAFEAGEIFQEAACSGNQSVITRAEREHLTLTSEVEVIVRSGRPICRVQLCGQTSSLQEGTAADPKKAWLVVSVRPYNPEGVSFVHDIALLALGNGWRINGEHDIRFNASPQGYRFSHYDEGDVYRDLLLPDARNQVKCKVGMASAAGLFEIPSHNKREVTVEIPLIDDTRFTSEETSVGLWKASLKNQCALDIPDRQMQSLYEIALRTLVLHSPDEVYAGPYRYKHFWFRDAAFIAHALVCAGFTQRAEGIIDRFFDRQTRQGYFHSQTGEWDSNGQVLWLIQRFCELAGKPMKSSWRRPVQRAGQWIQKRRLSEEDNTPHGGLLPPGFSAEHLGPSDYYYWDNFWSVAGLRAGAALCSQTEDHQIAMNFQQEADSLLHSIERSLKAAEARIGSRAMPASPYRRLDSGAVGSLAAGYPLQLWAADDPRLIDTVDYLTRHCLIENGFFHDIIHSGINPYLTLHIAQVLLRAGDGRFFDLMRRIATVASGTGQWPEAIHPHTGGGCMGDGQHVWAASEWILMMRNCFVREEKDRLILCGGISQWCVPGKTLSFGPAPTSFGTISLSVTCNENDRHVDWEGSWWDKAPLIEVRMPGYQPMAAQPNQTSIRVPQR